MMIADKKRFSVGIALLLGFAGIMVLIFIPLLSISSINSMRRIPFFTTIPPSPTIPNPVITTEMFILNIAKPSNTPITLNMISDMMITGLDRELNWITRIRKIIMKAIERELL